MLVLLGMLGLYLILCWLGSLHPLLEAITNVRAQVAFLALLPLVGFILTRDWQLAAVSALAFGLLVAPMVPYWATSPDPAPPPGTELRAMQYNIHFENEDYAAIADHILKANADVVVLHELLPQQWQNLEPLLATDYEHRIAAPLDALDGQPGGGMAMLNRTALSQIDLDAAFSPTSRVVLAASTPIGDQDVVVTGLHPHASRTNQAKVDLRTAQLAGVADLVAETPGPAIVLTDLNVAPTSPLYHEFLDDLGWRDPHRAVGWQSSWPTWGAGLGLPIDHVFVSNHVRLHGYQMGDGAGSDHRSIVAELSLPAG